jgi:undecaprenyl-phosphate 4-deoxy-4-formamido-L-arabinose transferase
MSVTPLSKISVIIPVYNGALSISRLVAEVLSALEGFSPEIVLVNDGSADDSEAVCESIARSNPLVKFISLRRNFGEHNAVMCGLNHMTGDAAVIIDDDFQNPPHTILALVEELQRGYDVVYSCYPEKKHHWFRNLGSKFNDLLATYLLRKPSDLYLSSFKAIRREVVDEIVKYTGPYPYIDGLIFRVTRSVSRVTVQHESRAEGRSNYTLKKLISLWLNMFLNFSILPLRFFTVSGIAVFVVGFIFSIAAVIEKLSSPAVPLGYTSLFVAILLLAGVQMIFLGLIGEYLGKTYLEQNGTPQWVIRKKILPGDEERSAAASRRELHSVRRK